MIEVGARITTDTGQATKSINDLQKELKVAKKDFNDAKVGSDEYTEAQKRVKKATEDLTKANGDGSGAFGVLKEKILGTVPGLASAETGTKSFGTALKALAANPIILVLTAIVAALSLLYAAFTNTMAGAQKMEAVFTGIKASLTVIVDRLTTFGNAIIKVFSGDFKGAAEDAKKAFTGIGDAIGNTFNRAKTIQEGLQKIRQEERDDAKDKANRLARLATIKEMLNDEDISVQEKKRLAAELKEASNKNNIEDLDRQKRKTAFEIELINLKTNKSEEDIKRINELNIEVDATEREGKQEGFRINKVVRNLEKQDHAQKLVEIEEEKKKLKELNDQKLEAAKNISAAENIINENNRQYQIAKLRKHYDEQIAEAKRLGLKTMALNEAYFVEKNKLEDKWAKEDKEKQKEIDDKRIAKETDQLKNATNVSASEIAIRQANLDAKKRIDEEELKAKDEFNRLISDGLSALSDLVGKNTMVGKALAIASTTISTYFAAQKAYDSQMAIATPDAPIRAAIAAGVAIASGIARVKAIATVQVPGQGSGGSVPSVSSPSAPVIPRPTVQTSTVLSGDALNKINASASRAYVLESDIANNQQRISRINRAARLG